MIMFFYKEWIKINRCFLIIFLASMGFCCHAIIEINNIVETNGLVELWTSVLMGNINFFSIITYIPLLSGLSIGFVQFYPEIIDNRIKLTLHLPCSTYRSVGSMLLLGEISLLVMSLYQFVVFDIVLHKYFAEEIVRYQLLSILPWYLAGMIAYLFVAWICFEPRWQRRICNILLSALLLRIFFLNDSLGAYNSFIPILLVLTILSVSLPFLSIERYKNGLFD